MILVDTFDSQEEADFLKAKLSSSGISFKEDQSASGLQVFINESDEGKLNELIKNLD